MKYVKILGLLAVAAAAMMAFAASASATELTSPKGTNYTGTITAVNESKHVSLTGPLGLAVECETSHVKGKVTAATSTGAQTVSGNIEELTFEDCTNGYVVHVEALGTLEAHTTTSGVNNSNGTVTSNGTTVTVTNTPAGTCSYRTQNTDIGDLTGSTTTGGTATFDISATIPRHAGSFFCGASGVWEGNYLITTPNYLDVD